ncbi:MAG: hypothetical protein RR877_01160 [Aurantimicrobium sp.]|uniref:hypothetical protein n=1 Tax=Aurantimicrobium sp. TaxID=1930784 RepID=UPI002FCC91C9
MEIDYVKHHFAIKRIKTVLKEKGCDFISIIIVREDPDGGNGIYFNIQTKPEKDGTGSRWKHIPLPTSITDDKIVVINISRLEGERSDNIYIQSETIQELYKDLQTMESEASSNLNIIV